MKTEADQVNCLGYVYYRFGLQKNDQWLVPNDFSEIMQDFDEVSKEDADVIAVVLHESDPVFVHMAALDPSNKNWVIHRRASGANITRQPLVDIYSSHRHQEFRFKFLKLKTK